MAYYAILQTKSTRSRGESWGRLRGLVWSTQLNPGDAKRCNATVQVCLSQLLSSDEGEAEVLAKFTTYKKLHAAMEHWHAVCQKTVFAGTSRQRNNQIIELARKTFNNADLSR